MAAGRQKKTSELIEANTIADSDLIVIVSGASGNTPGTRTVTKETLFNGVSEITVDKLVITNQDSFSASPAITFEKGTIWFDTNYLYVATANNVAKRVALSSF
jgi:hypothetical protein